MAADNFPSQEDSLEPLLGFSANRLRLFMHYADPASPAFGNRTKAAELAGFKGTRASLRTEGYRTIALARTYPGLANLLIDTGCTLDRALERVSAALTAKHHRVFLQEGRVIHVEAGDNHPVQLQASNVILKLHLGTKFQLVSGGITQESLPAAAAAEEEPAVEKGFAEPIALPEKLTPEQQELQRTAKSMSPRGRMLTLEYIDSQEAVLRAKMKLAEVEEAVASKETESRAEEDGAS